MEKIDGKTKVLGIVAEYNPWHLGHSYQLEETKKISGANYSVAVMNGNFTQRGEPAILDKWTRAEMALKGGIDLVVELPFYFGCNSAEYFAKGAVDILINSGIVTHMGFGSESGDIGKIQNIAQLLVEEPKAFKNILVEKIQQGMSFPRARMEAVSAILGPDSAEILNSPNNILAIEYVKELIRQQSQIEPVTIARKGAGYHDEECCQLASASKIRKELRDNACTENLLEDLVPKTTADILLEHKDRLIFKDNPRYYQMLQHRLLSASNNLIDTFSAIEGIENAFLKHVRRSKNLEELLEKVKSKRYTYAGLSRIATHMIMNFNKWEKEPKYIRILGFNEKGKKLLKMIKKSVKEPYVLVTNVNKSEADMSLDIKAQDIYNILAGENLYEKSDFVRKPVIIENFEK